MEIKFKPFDLEAAKNGAPVVTRDGQPVRIICFDKQGGCPIVVLCRLCDERLRAAAEAGGNCLRAGDATA